MKNYWIPGRDGTTPYYWREMANRNARRRNTVEELSARLRECLAVLDDANYQRGRRATKRVDFAARLAHTPAVVRTKDSDLPRISERTGAHLLEHARKRGYLG